MRRKHNDVMRTEQQIRRNLVLKSLQDAKNTMRCPAKLLDESGNETGEICGCGVFDKKTLYTLTHIPEVVCGVKGGQNVSRPAEDHFMCVRCGAHYAPEAWKAILNEQAESNGSPKLIIPDSMEHETEA